MQSKLLDYVAEREQLAAALAHDLRTPLTRIRLRLALVEDEALAKSLAKDLSDIEAISRSVIDFATSELANEEKEKVDLWSLLLSIADNYPDATLDERNSDMLDAIAYCQPVQSSAASRTSLTTPLPMAVKRNCRCARKITSLCCG